MSDYVELMQLRKLAILQGDEKLADELFKAADELVRLGIATDKEILAASYL